jgi:hypothetical protein
MIEAQRKVEAFGVADVYTHTEVKQTYRADGAREIARTSGGIACGIELAYGKGVLTALGFALGYSSDEHLRVYEKLVLADGIGRDAKVSDPQVQFTVRRFAGGSYLFLINPHNETRRFTADGRPYALKPFSCRVVRRRAAFRGAAGRK